MYDMYPWDCVSPGGSAPPNPPDLGGTFPPGPPAPRRGDSPGPLTQAASARAPRTQAPRVRIRRNPLTRAPLTYALQFALDRRDNGGDTLSPAGQAPARPARQ